MSATVRFLGLGFVFGLWFFGPSVSAHELNPKVIEAITGEVVVYDHHASSSEADPRHVSRRFYTLPEWYIVYTAQEYGAHVAGGGRPSQFPYLRSTSQLWEVWSQAERAAAAPPDSTTNTVLWTISLSTSVEQVLIGVYEATIGRVFEWLHFGYKTTEDRYTDAVAIEYGAFLTQTPWYAFPYGERLMGLWRTWGWSSLSPRGIERRLVFTLGYGLKAVYGGVIGYLSQSQLGTAGLVTEVVVREADAVALAGLPEATVAAMSEETVTLSLPRYRAFLAAAEAVVAAGGVFESIQGHDR